MTEPGNERRGPNKIAPMAVASFKFVGVRFDPALAAETDRAAAEAGTNRSAIIRAALRVWLEDQAPSKQRGRQGRDAGPIGVFTRAPRSPRNGTNTPCEPHPR
jgi:hypothetical protein